MLLQELKVGSKTLGNMLSSGRFAVVAVEDVRASLRSPRISAPAALPNAAPPSPGQPPPPSPAEQFPSSRTWPPDGGRSPRPDEPASPPPATAAGSEDPSPQAATRDEAPHGSGEQRDAFAEPAAKLAPATPEQESPAGAYPLLETNVTRSGRLLADDQLENPKMGSTELIIAQIQSEAAAARQHRRNLSGQGQPSNAAPGIVSDSNRDRAPIASAVIAPPSVTPLPSPFSLEGGSQLLGQDSPGSADGDAEAGVDAAAPLPLGDTSPAPQTGLPTGPTQSNYDRWGTHIHPPQQPIRQGICACKHPLSHA